jgi:two-component system osmolarity sensor histidine kinase EnvZ
MWYRLKSYLPRSLYGRAALILVVPVVAIQLVVSIIFIQRHFDGVTRQLTRGVALETQFLLAEVEAAPSLAEAQARARAIGMGLGMVVGLPVTDQPPATDRREPWDLSGREVGSTMHEAQTAVIAVDLQANPREVQMWLATRYGPMLVALPRLRVSASNPHQLLVVMGLASVLMTTVAFVFLRNQLVPITRMAAAAEAFGRGQSLPYRPRGATEVRAAGTAFLDMRARIERQIEQRTLMLSGVSHDLRAPLTRLKLGLSMLPEDEETLALQGDVEDMARLVDEFLAFARGDAMEETVPVDPADLVAQVTDKARRGGLAVTLGPCHGTGVLLLRPQAVMRALDNLIGNAVRFGSRAVLSYDLTDRHLRLVVEDDGPGIPEAQRDEALRPFIRLDAARDPNHGGGVGLGLSIAADTARTHGGVLRLGTSAELGGLRAELVLAR